MVPRAGFFLCFFPAFPGFSFSEVVKGGFAWPFLIHRPSGPWVFRFIALMPPLRGVSILARSWIPSFPPVRSFLNPSCSYIGIRAREFSFFRVPDAPFFFFFLCQDPNAVLSQSTRSYFPDFLLFPSLDTLENPHGSVGRVPPPSPNPSPSFSCSTQPFPPRPALSDSYFVCPTSTSLSTPSPVFHFGGWVRSPFFPP